MHALQKNNSPAKLKGIKIMLAVCAFIDENSLQANAIGPQLRKEPQMTTSSVYALNDHGQEHCPSCGIHLSNGISEHGDIVNDKILRHTSGFRYECLGCGAGFGEALRRVGNSSTRAAAISASWKNKTIAQARAHRSQIAVVVPERGEQLYRSVAQAFGRLGLPMNKHQTFRRELKLTGAKAYGPLQFRVLSA